MLWLLVIVCAGGAAAGARAALVGETPCGLHTFRCGDGGCARADAVCDGVRDCADHSDESDCFALKRDALTEEPDFVFRRKRQAACRKNEWRCRDGTCIGFDGVCDGVRDCADGSDETHALCRKMKCQSNWFRCTYGACVDGTAACNGVNDCADGSDELQPRCFNDTDEIGGKFKCQDGSTIEAWSRCDGAPDCADGSDETVRACAGMQCPSYAFQCAYGACVDKDSDCNEKKDCADGSDEDDELCNRMGSATSAPGGGAGTGTGTPAPPNAGGACKLPAFPQHGSYVVSGHAGARPGDAFDSFILNYTCDAGYGAVGTKGVYCYSGFWSEEPPRCVRLCRLTTHPSVEYACHVPGSNGGTRPCERHEPDGTLVSANCRTPNYYSTQILPPMKCIEGSWNYIATCVPECGRETPAGEILVIDGRTAERGELPWHAGVYRKDVEPYMQICGGSIISTTIVVSAAHCFWSDVAKLQPASRFAVAAGKIYRPWNNPRDADAQKSDVAEIKIPSRFRGAQTNFQDDIALLILTVPLTYETYVRPVCINFDIQFEKRQLQPGHLGKVAGWGYTSENGTASQVLKVVDLPYIDINQCLSEALPGFREYITSDKICAGYDNGTALCKGDSGGGLAFPEEERGVRRYYLRGVVSTAPSNEKACNAFAVTSFTQISAHEHFITENFGGSYV